MRSILIYTSILILFLSSCEDRGTVSDSPIQPKKNLSTSIAEVKNLSHLDTTIVLSDTKGSHISNKDLSANKAKDLLYKYFKRKGIIARSELRDTSVNSYGKLCVEYDTLYQLQTNKYSGAIILYWLGQADLNGHCFQPSKAVVFNTIDGYMITNEEFIPANYSIDSVIKSNIYGYDYECGGRGIVRYLKVTLN